MNKWKLNLNYNQEFKSKRQKDGLCDGHTQTNVCCTCEHTHGAGCPSPPATAQTLRDTSAVHSAGSHHAIAAGAHTSRLSGFPSHLRLAKPPWRSTLTVHPRKQLRKATFLPKPLLKATPRSPQYPLFPCLCIFISVGVGMCVCGTAHACLLTTCALHRCRAVSQQCCVEGALSPSFRTGNGVQLREDKRFICTSHWAS